MFLKINNFMNHFFLNKGRRFVHFVSLPIFLLFSCNQNFTPKPVGYNRFILPPHEFKALPDSLPYFFEYSKHAKLLADTSWISEKFWIELYYPEWKADINITYKALNNNTQLLKEYFDDSYTLTAKHQIKAYSIDEVIIKTPSGKTAVIAELEGEVPSQFQFTITDSVHHFLRGALYFNTKVANDSLSPAIAFIKEDILHMLNTTEWRRK